MEREGSKDWLRRILRGLLLASLPIVLFLTALRLTMTQPYVRLAYALPGFPADPYGFDRAQRVQLATHALRYLTNDAGIEFLGNQTFEDGSPLYNARELRHMEDVKSLAKVLLRLWLSTLLLSAISAGVLLLRGWQDDLASALVGGGQFTLLVMVVLAVLSALSFSFLFVGFHRIFFEGDTWLFRYSDTLIRLFPTRFWQQVFAFLMVATAVQAAGVWWLGRGLRAISGRTARAGSQG